MNSVHFQSDSVEWSTPQNVFDELNKEFGFVLDAAATKENAKCSAYYTAEDDGLLQNWTKHGGPVWLNPPYGRGIGKWVCKAAETARLGTTVVCLIPARTDTRYFHAHIWDVTAHAARPGVEVRFVKGRLRFGGVKTPAPFPSAVVVFRKPPVSQ